MANLTLYHIAPSRSSIVLWMLEEIGEPYDIHLLSMKNGTNREPAYLAVNPMGKVRRRHHRGGGDLLLPRRRISPGRPQHSAGAQAARALSQMAVLRSWHA